MKKSVKRVLMFLLCFTMAFAFVGCNASADKKPGGNDNQGGNQGGGDPVTLSAPVASIDMDDGTVTWTSVENASGYAYRIDGGSEVAVAAGDSSITLTAGQSAQVKAVGNGTSYFDSGWSNTVDYTYSYIVNNVGEETSGLNIYTVDGESILDTFYGTKRHGNLLEAGVDYIFEFDKSMKVYDSALLITGVENAVISDVVWSDSPYSFRDGETTEPDILREVAYDDMSSDYPSYHRCHWGTYWGLTTYGWVLGAEPPKTDGAYDTTAKDFWKIPANECGQYFGQHWLATEKATHQVPGKEFVRFKINFKSLDRIWTPNYNAFVTDGKAIDSLAGRTGFNMYACLSACHYYLFGDGYVEPKISGATESYAKNAEGEETNGINIYDKESGDLVLDAMTEANKGDVLQSDKEYVFEFKVDSEVDAPLILAGLARAVVTDIQWTDSLYGDEEQDASAIQDDVYMTTHSVSTADNQKLFHVLTYDATNNRYTGVKGAKKTGAVHDYQWSSGNKCSSLTGMYLYMTGKRTGETEKNYFRMTVKFVSDETKTFAKTGFMHIGAGDIIRNTENENYGNYSAKDFNLFLYYGSGSYSVYLADALSAFEEYVPPPDADDSHA